MYKGKYHNRYSMNGRKTIALLASLILVMSVAIGGTVAYIISETNNVTNVFTPSKVTTAIDEKFDGTTKKDVVVTNTGDTEAYIRAAVVINWQTEDGKIFGELPKEGVDYSIVYNTTDWTKNGDFWYYNGTVDAGESTEVLIRECTMLKASPADNEDYKLTVSILGSGIQAKPATVVQQVWGYTPGA